MKSTRPTENFALGTQRNLHSTGLGCFFFVGGNANSSVFRYQHVGNAKLLHTGSNPTPVVLRPSEI